MKRRKSSYSTPLFLLTVICFIILLGCSAPDATIDAPEHVFVPSYTLGSHTLEIRYYKADISYDWDPDYPFLPADPGEWFFGLGESENSLDVSTGQFSINGPSTPLFDQYQYRTISGSTHFQFVSYACEWDQDFWTGNWYMDYMSMHTFEYTPSVSSMNVWHYDNALEDYVRHYVKYIIYNDAPVVGGITGGTTLQWQGITLHGSGYDPNSDGITYQWDSDYDGVDFMADYDSSDPTITYDTPGEYTVAFRIVDDFDMKSIIRTATITVLPDNDGDGIIDSEDPDDDNDGLLDIDEINIHGTDPFNSDSDFDGLTDFVEVDPSGPGTSPLIADTDMDGLLDGQEIDLGTDPLNYDTDGDGISDGIEVNLTHTDPLNPDTTPPSITFCINDDAASSPSRIVYLSYEVSDSSGVSGVRFSDNGVDWTDWVGVSRGTDWTLPSGNGLKTVYMQAKDNAGNIGESSDDITLDIHAGNHLVEVVYEKAYIYDDHDHTFLEPLVPDPGEWVFSLYFQSWTSSSEYSVNGPREVNFPDLKRSGKINGDSQISFRVRAIEYDGGADHISNLLVEDSDFEMNTWYSDNQYKDDVRHFYKYIMHNNAPDANPISGGTIRLGESISLFGSAHDLEMDSFGYQWDMDYTGAFTIDSCSQNPVFTYTALGTYTVAFRAVDKYGASSEIKLATVEVRLNNAPVALNDAANTDEDTSVVIDVLSNDSDLDGDTLTIDSIGPASYGTVSINAGMITYTPASDFSGIDSFIYRVSDGHGGTDTARVWVTVNPVNDAPVATDDFYAIDEDTSLILTSPGPLVNDYDIDDDSLYLVVVTYPQHGGYVIGSDGHLEYYPDTNWYGTDYFTYRAYDGSLYSAIVTVTITVRSVNDAPIAVVGGPYHTFESVPTTFDASISFDIDGDALQFRWDFDSDGIWDTGWSSNPLATHVWYDDFAGIVTVEVTDGEYVDSISAAVIVHNIAPTVDAGADQIVYEGDTVTFSPTVMDPGSDTFTYEWDFGDGSPVSDTPSHIYADNGVYTVTLTVTDDDGGEGTDTLTVTVNNVPPLVFVWATQFLPEGDTASFVGNYFDPGTLDTYVFLWDFGDGSPTVTGTLTPTHVYADNGVYTVTFTVTDDDGGVGSDTVTITVLNIAPVVEAGLDQTVNEGATVFFDGSFTDPGFLDTHTIAWNFGDGSSVETGSLSPTHEYGDNGVYTVTLTVTDKDGGVGSDTLTIIVDNVAPAVNVGPDQIVDEDTTVDFTGIFTDPGWLDSFDYSWNFGDGSPAVTGTALTPYTLLASYVYQYPGVYTVTLTVTDDDGGVGTDSLVVTVRDITPPETTLNFIGLYHESDHIYISSTETQILLTAEDAEMPHGSGVAAIQYQLDSLDPSGWVTYTEPFTVDLIGTHTIYYRSFDNAGNVEGEQSVEVVVNASELTYLGEFTGVYSDPTCLQALLIDIATQQPIQGKIIHFAVGSQTGFATTDEDGCASITIILDQPGGTYPVTACFYGDAGYLTSASEPSDYLIQKETAYVEYTGSTVVPNTATEITLRATVFDDDDGNWGDLTKIFVTFRIYTPDLGGNVLYEMHGPYQVVVTVVDGVGVVEVEIPNLSDGSYIIIISLDPDANAYYQSDPSDDVVITVYEPTGDFVTGGGWIVDSDGHKGNFGFNVKYKKNGLPKGQFIFVYRVGEYKYRIKANAWLGMAIVGNHSFFEAKCVVEQYIADTDVLVWSEGNYLVRVDVYDNADNDNLEDVFQIRVYDKQGLVYFEAGFDPYGTLLGGNIVIHIDKEE